MAASWRQRLSGRRRARRVYLHIGAMKTGTTYLQAVMELNRDRLADAGFLFPGERWADQSRAVREVLFRAQDPRVRAQTEGKWAALCREAAGHEGVASIVSMEFLSFADRERAAVIVNSLKALGLEVHVVLTVRDAQTAIPAQWQTSCRNGGRVPYRRFVRGVRAVVNDRPARANRGARLFERTQGIPRMLEVWVPLVGPENTHVITVPQRGGDPAVLWRRFAEVIGVDPAGADLSEIPLNSSLGHASSELLRRINVELGHIPPIDYWRIVKGQLGRWILGSRVELEQPVRLNRRGLAVARRWNRRVRRAISGHELEVVGSLEELPVQRRDEEAPEELPEPTPEELLAAAITAYEGLLRLRAILLRRCEQVRNGLPADHLWTPLYLELQTEPPVPTATPAETAWRAAADPVGEAVGTLAALIDECISMNQLVDVFPTSLEEVRP